MANLILRVSFKLDILTTEISRILNLLDSGETAFFTPMGDKPDLFDIQHNNVALFSGLNIVIRCSYLSIGLSINTLCGGILTAGGIPPLRNWLLSSTENTVVKYNQGVMTSPIGGCLDNQGVTDNKKGSTANATSLNNSFINHCANDNSDNNANFFNILVQRRLIVNYSPDCLVLRFSDLSFFSQASITHAEKLEFSLSVIKLISSINSSGNRIPLYCDLLFLCPVAISKFQSKCFNTRKNTIKIFLKEVFKQKYLDVFKQFDVTYLNTLIIYIKKKQNPIGAENTYRASNHNVKRGNTMAMYKSTQTHPKFLWRFFSCQQFKYFLVEATNEQEARSMLPDSPCIFSARICQGVIHG
ncbi:host cell division inhibitor Icd-like protein [Providencia rettgeri]|uniref:host cell division inhibitor Icd-like protein n=1 Tax=Providencia rettgeri TaxID=587 RepID=UPI0026BB6A74